MADGKEEMVLPAIEVAIGTEPKVKPPKGKEGTERAEDACVHTESRNCAETLGKVDEKVSAPESVTGVVWTAARAADNEARSSSISPRMRSMAATGASGVMSGLEDNDIVAMAWVATASGSEPNRIGVWETIPRGGLIRL